MKVVYDDLFADEFKGHSASELECPEQPTRFVGIKDILDKYDVELVDFWIDGKVKNALRQTHTENYIREIKNSEELRQDDFLFLEDSETYTTKGSFDTAMRGVAATLKAADIAQRGGKAFALVRPPGHHAHSYKGHGFCLFNNVAVAAEYLARGYRHNKVLVVDIDIHFGDGTYDIVSTSNVNDKLYYFSINQEGIFPFDEQGCSVEPPKNDEFSTNIFLPRGISEDKYRRVFDREFSKVVKSFKPNIIAVSAGFDSCIHDREMYGESMGLGFSLTWATYRHIKKSLDKFGKPYFCVLEGGYNPESIEVGLRAFLEK